MTFKIQGIDLKTRYMSQSLFKTEGNLYAWGSNTYGQLGEGLITTRYSSPTQIGTSSWKQIAVGSTASLAIKNDGTLWSVGDNTCGQLGLGDTTNRLSYTQIGTENIWSSIACGRYSSFAIKGDGTLWTWGNNVVGQLGYGNALSYRSTPVQVGTLNNWQKIFTSMDGSVFAIKTDGTLWAWGRGSSGQLSLSNSINISSPTQVGSLSNWSSVSLGSYHMVAIRSDGTMWSCGSNAYGQLGLSDLTTRYSMIQVGTESNWNSVSCGEYSNLAVKNDGTLWAWGAGGSFQLGLGNQSNRSVPTQVGSLSNWNKVLSIPGVVWSAGYAIKTDGTLWAWGHNSGDGSLGLNTTTGSPSTPVQIGSENTWINFAGSDYCRFGLKIV